MISHQIVIFNLFCYFQLCFFQKPKKSFSHSPYIYISTHHHQHTFFFRFQKLNRFFKRKMEKITNVCFNNLYQSIANHPSSTNSKKQKQSYSESNHFQITIIKSLFFIHILQFFLISKSLRKRFSNELKNIFKQRLVSN